MNQNYVFVLDSAERQMTPCTPGRARQLLREQKAAVYRQFPFTIILKEEKPEAIVKTVVMKVDPGSKQTGIALVMSGRVIFAAVLEHRGLAIMKSLQGRKGIRCGRRHRNTRYRKPRFNRTKPAGWLAPSLAHRISTTMTWVRRFSKFVVIDELSLERVKFDMQKMQDPEVSGVEYQQGELQGYQVREYLLEKWGRKCSYCDKEHEPLQIEHIVARANKGSNCVSNLTIACEPCNKKKGTQNIRTFLKHDPKRAEYILSLAKKPLHDAAAVNATRNAILDQFLKTGLPVEVGDGALTKFNRTKQDYPKAHWIDAACNGESGKTVQLNPELKPLQIIAKGHGTRQRCRPNAYGFPIGHAPRAKKFAGFQTGDIVTARIPKGKFAGSYAGRIAIRHRPSFSLRTKDKTFDVHPKYLTIIHHADGYAYY
jgi:5-methylcytosine-specific restriction endonuclease McrA